MPIKYDKPENWRELKADIVSKRCRTFNMTAESYLEGKVREKNQYTTWGKTSADCIRHLEVLVKK